MPTYVYRCTKCEREFEIEQRIVEDALTHCDVCDAETLKRVIQPVGVAFKGSGFYVNDSKSPSPAATSVPEKTETTATETAKPAETAAPATPAPAASTESKPSV